MLTPYCRKEVIKMAKFYAVSPTIKTTRRNATCEEGFKKAFDKMGYDMVRETTTKGYTVEMRFKVGCGLDSKEGNKCYLFHFYDEEEHIIFTKIGTTTKSCEGRLRQEIATYRNKNKYPVHRVEVLRIIDTGEMPPESYESILRATIIKNHPNTYHKNDRFFDVAVGVNEFDNICEMFAGF